MCVCGGGGGGGNHLSLGGTPYPRTMNSAGAYSEGTRNQVTPALHVVLYKSY